MAEKDRIRRNQFKLSLSDVESELLKQKASEYGISRTDFLRQLIVSGGVQNRPKVDLEMYGKIQYELNRIGNNINQIAYVANLNKAVDESKLDVIRKQLDEIWELCEKIACK